MTADARPGVLLLSSNLRRRYAEDILTALSLPRGALLRFRYEAEYVAPDLQTCIADGSVISRRTVIAFVADVDEPAPFLIPIRLASVVRTDKVADMIVLQLSVEDYANLEDLPLTEQELAASGKAWLDKLRERNGGRYYPAVTKFPDLRIHEGGDDDAKWLGIARRLSMHDTFAHSYFMRVSQPLLGNGAAMDFDDQGRLAISDRRSARLPVVFYSKRYSDDVPRTLSCVTDGTFLRVSSDDAYDVASRYDSVEFWLQPETMSFDALTRVTLRLGGPQDGGAGAGSRALTTHAWFPVIVRRSRRRLSFRVAGSIAGAFLVALPAILGQDSPLWARMLAALTGAACIAYATVVSARGGK
ncbi:hypothetical protein [Actinomadura sp. GTD37]|uniref:hypothetical protein n=1 Tax=Actinomadura sp. GTD37 TaxID=1778030 RepID=UPI0035C10548